MGFCTIHDCDPSTMGGEGASWLLRFTSLWPNEGRNAYAGLLLVPGWESIRFSPFIKDCKRLWATHGDKYSEFCDAKKVLETLMHTPLLWDNVEHVRDRTILKFNFVALVQVRRPLKMLAPKVPLRPGRILADPKKGAAQAPFRTPPAP